MTNKFFNIAIFLLTFIFVSCASIQTDKIMSTDSIVQDSDVLTLEEKLCKLDATSILLNKTEDAQFIKDCDALILEIENAEKESGMNRALLARLYALEGRVFLLKENKTQAKSFYSKSYKESKGDSQTIILGSRLGLISSIDNEQIISGSNENALLVFERGLQYYKDGDYSSAVGKFDFALMMLPDFYHEIYAEIRNKAWSLREFSDEVSDKKILSLLNKDKITVGEMILITQETTDLLNNYTGAQKLSENDLYNKLNRAGLFTSRSAVQKNSNGTAKRNSILTRFLSARFLWNIFCVKKNILDGGTRYSRLYRKASSKSPVQDVQTNSEDFDAVLGVVENEIMSLPDGRNFLGDEKVSAAEFNSWTKKIK